MGGAPPPHLPTPAYCTPEGRRAGVGLGGAGQGHAVRTSPDPVPGCASGVALGQCEVVTAGIGPPSPIRRQGGGWLVAAWAVEAGAAGGGVRPWRRGPARRRCD